MAAVTSCANALFFKKTWMMFSKNNASLLNRHDFYFGLSVSSFI
jgi:hypothetical protein